MEFIVAVLTQEKRWKYANSDSLEDNVPIEKSLPGYVASLPVLDSCLELIGIGVASQEGTRESEFYTADKRADKILEVLRPIVKGKNIYKVNLGKYAIDKQCKETSWQRRVIIGGIKSRDQSMQLNDIRVAIYNGLEKSMKDKIGIELTDYNDFILTFPN